MKGSWITKLIAFIFLGVIGGIAYFIASRYVDTIYAILIAVVSPILLVVALGFIGGEKL